MRTAQSSALILFLSFPFACELEAEQTAGMAYCGVVVAR